MGEWVDGFRMRMRDFAMLRPPRPGEVPLSIKVGVTGGCYHRECAPHAYRLIDAHLEGLAAEADSFAYEEHESGPEILAFATIAGSAITLASSVIGLVAAIIQARSNGIREGDRAREPLRVKLRRTTHDGDFHEELVLEVDSHDEVSTERLEAVLLSSAARLLTTELAEHSEQAPQPDKPRP